MSVISAVKPEMEMGIEQFRRSLRAVWERGDTAERRALVDKLPRDPALNQFLNRTTGYSLLPDDPLPLLPELITYCQSVREARRNDERHHKKADYNPTILFPKTYEDAPPVFDFALSDRVLQIAADYLEEVPILMKIRLWWTPVNDRMEGSQLFHRDGRQWLTKRAKFLINMDEVDEKSGPFTFIAADKSETLSRRIGSMQASLKDEIVFETVNPDDVQSLTGPAGTGVTVDSTRCYHYGARAREKERLLLVFQFVRRVDARDGGNLKRTEAFMDRFGDDPVRSLVIPNEK